MNNGWIGVDFDGTLAEDIDPFDPGKCGKPLYPMINFVNYLLDNGENVKIFTARVSNLNSLEDIRKSINLIDEFCKKHFNRILPITNEKDYNLKAIFDDRAFHVDYNIGTINNQINKEFYL